jgi:hypothetical protein
MRSSAVGLIGGGREKQIDVLLVLGIQENLCRRKSQRGEDQEL